MRITVFQRLAWAAERRREERDFSAWCFLRQFSNDILGGSGVVPRLVARDLVRDFRGCDRRTAQGIIASLIASGYATEGRGRLFLAAPERLALRFGLESVGLGVLVEAYQLAFSGQKLRAVLACTVYKTDGEAEQYASLSFSKVREITGIPERTMARYAKLASINLGAVYARVVDEGDEPRPANHEIGEFVRWGHYGRRKYRRLANHRTTRSKRGSRSLRRHHDERLWMLMRRGADSRRSELPSGLTGQGQQRERREIVRTFYAVRPGSGEESAEAWLISEEGRKRRQSGRSFVSSWRQRGRRRYLIAAPLEVVPSREMVAA